MDTAADLIKRNITPFLFMHGGEAWVDFFAGSPDPDYQELSKRFVIAKDLDDFNDMARKALSTGLFADLATYPWFGLEGWKDWYRSSRPIVGDLSYFGHLASKKWPLKKVL